MILFLIVAPAAYISLDVPLPPDVWRLGQVCSHQRPSGAGGKWLSPGKRRARVWDYFDLDSDVLSIITRFFYDAQFMLYYDQKKDK